MRALPGIGSHESARRLTDEWLTPRPILDRLGPFDLDPCSPVVRPWDTAARHLTVLDDGLEEPWEGRVWLNPPYSTIGPWMARMAAHGRGTALTFARTETAWFQEHVWPTASGLLFLAGRVSFLRADRPGVTPAEANAAGAPSVLAAWGDDDAARLRACGLRGAFVAGAAVVP